MAVVVVLVVVVPVGMAVVVNDHMHSGGAQEVRYRDSSARAMHFAGANMLSFSRRGMPEGARIICLRGSIECLYFEW